MSLKDKMKEALFIFEESEDFEIKKKSIKDIVKLGREYNLKYKNPYQHKFVGVVIGLSEPVLKELENQINLCKQENN